MTMTQSAADPAPGQQPDHQRDQPAGEDRRAPGRPKPPRMRLAADLEEASRLRLGEQSRVPTTQREQQRRRRGWRRARRPRAAQRAEGAPSLAGPAAAGSAVSVFSVKSCWRPRMTMRKPTCSRGWRPAAATARRAAPPQQRPWRRARSPSRGPRRSRTASARAGRRAPPRPPGARLVDDVRARCAMGDRLSRSSRSSWGSVFSHGKAVIVRTSQQQHEVGSRRRRRGESHR